LAHLAEEALDGFTHFDTRFIRTVKLLFTRPGALSNAYFRGGRSRYTKPLSLFIIINIIFFFVQPHTGLFGNKYAQYVYRHYAVVHEHLRQTGEPEQLYAARFNENLQHQKKSLFIVAVPALALVMGALFAGSGRTYAEHLVLSIQFYAFLLAYLAAIGVLVIVPFALGLPAASPIAARVAVVLQGEPAIDLMIFVGLTVYIYLALRRAYETTYTRSAISAIVLSVAVGFSIALYHNLLFYTAFWTT
jgi:TM2 domain-containing membrane protein YozV